MKLDVLVATMHCEDVAGLVRDAGITGSAVVVNQDDGAPSTEQLSDTPRVVACHTTERGLSRSRNRALDLASADICALADDDQVFMPTYEDRILGAFSDSPRTDVIAFQVHFASRLRKPSLQGERLRPPSLMRISSVQIAFRRERVQSSGTRFDTRFGAGARFFMGEELVFLSELRRAGLRIDAVPLETSHLVERPSTWFNGYDERFFRSRGASFAIAFPRTWRAVTAQWAVRKRGLYASEVSVREALDWMRFGAEEVLGDGP